MPPMIKEKAIAKTELNAIPTIKRTRKRTKQIMIVMSAAFLVLISVFILKYLICVGWYDCNLKGFLYSVKLRIVFKTVFIVKFIVIHYNTSKE